MEITCRMENCGKICKSLQGWKQHMTASHGGWDESDLQIVAGITSGEGNVRERMSSFAKTIPSGGADTADNSIEGGESAPPPLAPTPMSAERRVKATPKKLRKILAGIPSEILRQTGIQLDNEDVEAMDEAGEFLSDVFGFEFSVPESKVVVRSRMWSIVWVAGVAGLVFIKHRFPDVFKYIFKAIKKKDGEETDNASEVSDSSVRVTE